MKINKTKSIKQTRNNKPWFSTACRKARNKYRNSKVYFLRKRSDTAKNMYKTNEKAYKKLLNKEINKYKDEMSKNLRSIRTKTPREYWKILNKNNKQRNTGHIKIDELYKYFKELNKAPEIPDDIEEIIDDEIKVLDVEDLNHTINQYISQDEILKAIKKLKNNKASGEDRIRNEYIKSSIHVMLPLYEKLFNIIFTTGKLPACWLEGNIIPIYKNKGGKNNPQNYRPITILSCIGKLFTSILNDRLNAFADEYKKIHENQAGFRKEYSTTDHLFSLHILSELLLFQKKRLYCAFIDFEKAFDNVWRKGLWYKLCVNDINGHMYNIITKMYNQIKSRIVHGDGISDYFNCENGVRQGENLSSFLFSIYLNDMHDFLQENVVNGLPTISEMFEQNLDLYFRLFVLLYADDTVLMAESAEQLQSQIMIFTNTAKNGI